MGSEGTFFWCICNPAYIVTVLSSDAGEGNIKMQLHKATLSCTPFVPDAKMSAEKKLINEVRFGE